mmetsp:Transcript_118610/g.330906  ORF Transcript_118610/g.330906 Transcript_118610/m.330906 type:complete len:301 (-) Transcript_118610:239-1141(-)
MPFPCDSLQVQALHRVVRRTQKKPSAKRLHHPLLRRRVGDMVEHASLQSQDATECHHRYLQPSHGPERVDDAVRQDAGKLLDVPRDLGAIGQFENLFEDAYQAVQHGQLIGVQAELRHVHVGPAIAVPVLEKQPVDLRHLLLGPGNGGAQVHGRPGERHRRDRQALGLQVREGAVHNLRVRPEVEIHVAPTAKCKNGAEQSLEIIAKGIAVGELERASAGDVSGVHVAEGLRHEVVNPGRQQEEGCRAHQGAPHQVASPSLLHGGRSGSPCQRNEGRLQAQEDQGQAGSDQGKKDLAAQL